MRFLSGIAGRHDDARPLTNSLEPSLPLAAPAPSRPRRDCAHPRVARVLLAACAVLRSRAPVL